MVTIVGMVQRMNNEMNSNNNNSHSRRSSIVVCTIPLYTIRVILYSIVVANICNNNIVLLAENRIRNR